MTTLHVFRKVTQEEQKVIFAKAENVKDAKNELSQGGYGSAGFEYVASLEESAGKDEKGITSLALTNRNSADIAVFEEV